MINRKERRIKRHKTIKYRIRSDENRPRLVVFKSNRFIYAQILNETNGKVLVAVSEKELSKRGKKMENALEVGRLVGKKALEKKIKKVVFDRGGYQYHGRVKNLAEGAREGGLIF